MSERVSANRLQVFFSVRRTYVMNKYNCNPFEMGNCYADVHRVSCTEETFRSDFRVITRKSERNVSSVLHGMWWF